MLKKETAYPNYSNTPLLSLETIRRVWAMDQMPNLGREKEMLDVLGLNTMEDLFANIPLKIRRNKHRL